MLNKIKNLLKKNETTILETKSHEFEPINLFDEINKQIKQELPESTKIAAQKIGLDLVSNKTPIEMTSGYIDFHVDEVAYAEISEELKSENPDLYYKLLYENAQKTLFQMKKVKRANEKVLEKMTHTEKQLEDSIRYYEHKHEHSKFDR